MKVPSKNDLKQQIRELEKQNAKLIEQRDAEKHAIWEKRVPDAIDMARKVLNGIFPGMVCKMHYEHVDGGGYWFTFELTNDDRRQTYCIRHTDFTEGGG